jgi:hypothetical protein
VTRTLTPMPPPAPPRLLVWVSGLVVAAGIVMAFLGALHTGATRDEAFHVIRMQNYLDHGYYAVDTALADTDPTGGAENTVVYGPVTSLLLHGFSVAVGAEDAGTVSTTPHAYDVRHLGVVLIGLLGTAAAAAIVRILLGSWRWALVGAAVLLAMPMWTGHLMFNVKDVPVATGYTLVTLALVAMAASGRRRVLRATCLAAGVLLAVGTRPAMVTAVVAGVLVLGVGLLITKRRDALRAAAGEVVVAGAVSYGALLLIYPRVYAHPGSMVTSAQKSANFRAQDEGSFWYVPYHVLAQTPLLLLVFLGIGLVAAVRLILVRRRDQPVQAVRLLLVGTQLAALPLVAMADRSDLEHGLRQLLFAVPAWGVLVTLGIATATRWRLKLWVVPAIAALALLGPVFDQLRLFPFQYTYFNPAFDLAVKNGYDPAFKVQTDYWRASAPELLSKIPTDGQIICGPNRTPNPGPGRSTIAGRYSVGPGRSLDCRLDPLGPLADLWKADHKPLGDTVPHSEFYAVIDNDYPLPANCTRTAAVTRPRHGRTITMLYLARCDSGPLSALTERPVRFVPEDGHQVTANFWRYLPRGWVKHSTTSGMDAGEQDPVIAFRAPAECSTRTRCTLAIEASGQGHLTASVNGHATEVVATSGKLLVELPAGTSDAWITFGSAQDNLRVRSIRLVEGTL